MTTKEIAEELEHYLGLYAIRPSKDDLTAILTFAAMLAGRVSK